MYVIIHGFLSYYANVHVSLYILFFFLFHITHKKEKKIELRFFIDMVHLKSKQFLINFI